LKKDVLKLRSVNNIVIAPAKTGKDKSNSTAVIKIAQTNNGIFCKLIPLTRIFNEVTIKLIAPNNEEVPEICKLKIAKSTEPPEWNKDELRGGYTVQPVPAPNSTNAEKTNNKSDGTSNQKLILFKRGKAISGAPKKIGNIQFPNPPIIAGITKKKIIKKA
jgi:hypothetical protein